METDPTGTDGSLRERRIQQPISLGLTLSVELHADRLAQPGKIGLSAADTFDPSEEHHGQYGHHHRARKRAQHYGDGKPTHGEHRERAARHMRLGVAGPGRGEKPFLPFALIRRLGSTLAQHLIMHTQV